MPWLQKVIAILWMQPWHGKMNQMKFLVTEHDQQKIIVSWVDFKKLGILPDEFPKTIYKSDSVNCGSCEKAGSVRRVAQSSRLIGPELS